MISAGAPAPDFTLPRTGGGTLTLSALRPAKVVLYFYPKDDTPGCTTEALDFTRLAARFRAAGTEVIGISKDSLARHESFCAKHRLGVTLVSDAEGRVCEEYGVWGEKKLYGRAFMGITRTTVLVGGDGIVAQVWPRVTVAGHAEEVLAAAAAL
ncbi:MAG: peroxiredoxin [Defluviimonas sp.]|uniref:peroxiredoxin n=1 Tax=Albidovulum sp. TaxID=1872424 RepID=UPI001D846BC1|nr:peroxiredoxin [Paracoccaceae bacterium]MCC0064230.1 peroxiredoxin [Defluviimonas sp.]